MGANSARKIEYLPVNGGYILWQRNYGGADDMFYGSSGLPKRVVKVDVEPFKTIAAAKAKKDEIIGVAAEKEDDNGQ